MYEKRPQRAGNAQLLALVATWQNILDRPAHRQILLVHPLAYRPNCRRGPIQQATGRPEELGRRGYKNSGSRHQKSALLLFPVAVFLLDVLHEFEQY